jgi:nonsense-mediated mRNA decay protein 3
MNCIVCDKNPAVIRGLCGECLSNHVQITTVGSVDVTMCPKCDSYKIGNSWSRGKVEDGLSRKLEEHLVRKDPKVTVRVRKDNIILRRLDSRIDFHTETQTDNVSVPGRSMSIPSKILLNSCPTCNKISGSYYESIIQLRTYTTDYSKIIDTVLANISNMLDNLDSSASDSFVSKITRVKEGVDIYLGKKTDGIKLTKYIHDHYFSETTITKKLAGRGDGGDLYRYTNLVRILNLKPGSVISHKGSALILQKINANTITVIDPITERRIDIVQNEFYNGQYTFSDEVSEIRDFIAVSSNNNETQLMDKKNFQTLTVKGTHHGEIKGFDYKGKILIFQSVS